MLERTMAIKGSFALGDDDKVDLRRQIRFSFTLDDVIIEMHDDVITL